MTFAEFFALAYTFVMLSQHIVLTMLLLIVPMVVIVGISYAIDYALEKLFDH
jgi:hypothetical protein